MPAIAAIPQVTAMEAEMINNKLPGLVLLLIMLVSAENSPHKNLSLHCSVCHSTANWKNIQFDHDSTGFELAGQHKTLQCRSCHSIKDFSAVSANCAGCHTDFHQGRLYQDCGLCHTAQNWVVLDAYKAHANTSFLLLGKHARLDCQTCHHDDLGGDWAQIQTQCVNCHRADYQSAQNPLHTNLGFGIICEDCHSPLSWTPASFKKHDERYFPIFSGSHAGEWDNCTTCHVVPGNYLQFSCFANCHEHNQSKMSEEHNEVVNFRYDSNACYSCHPRGNGGD